VEPGQTRRVVVGELQRLELALVGGVREQQVYSKHRVVLGQQGLLGARSKLVEPVADPGR
jgi:hypothetical protein